MFMHLQERVLWKRSVIDMKKKIAAFAALVIAASACTLRINSINSAAGYPVMQKYNVGDEVLMENDFFDNLGEAADGYSVTVTDKQLLSREDFCSKYNASDDEIDPNSDFILLVSVNVRNINNNNGNNSGINFRHFIFQNNAYINYLDDSAYPFVNDFKEFAFSLRFNSDKDFVIPFGFSADHINAEDILDENSELVVTLYPHKKSVLLN